MDNSKDQLILVNTFDEPIGEADKLTVHREGLLHRAFSIFLIDVEERKVLIQKRAKGKYHSSGLWANACCSHPRIKENLLDAARRRMNEEIGLSCELEELFSFTYRQGFSNGLTEYEIDHVIVGNYDSNKQDYLIDPDEVEELMWIDMDHLATILYQKPQIFASWFLICAPKVLEYMKELIAREHIKPVKIKE